MKKTIVMIFAAMTAMMAMAYDYVAGADIEIAAGETVRIPTGISGTPTLGNVTMAAGSKLYLPSDASQVIFGSLNGDGEVISEYPGNTWSTQLIQIIDTSVYAGKFTGFVRFFAYSQFNLTGTDSAFADFRESHAVAGAGAILGVAKLGLVCGTSSIGPSDNLSLRDGGALKYIGSGETTDHGISITQSGNDADCVIDAGDNGGLIWVPGTGPRGVTGEWFCDHDSYFSRLTLKGDNATPCEMRGTIRFEASANGMSAYMTKEGTGTWKLADYERRTKMRGPFAVREGTLQFESIADAGACCSLGMSDLLYDAPAGATVDPKYAVDYAFLIGGGVNPVFEFTGSGANSSNRKIALTGTKGTLSHVGTGSLALNGGVRAFDAGEKTLHLKGSAADGRAVVNGIADGAGKVSVVKEGAGSWTLGGDLTFSGSFEVTGGKAIIEGSTPARNYTWYRFTMQEMKNANDNGFHGSVYMQALGLFDADGNMVCRDLEEVRPDGYNDLPFDDGDWVQNSAFHPESLQPGQCSVGRVEQTGSWCPGLRYYPCNPPANIFSATGGWNGMMHGQTAPSLGDGSELSIVFRPRANEVIKYYDVMNLWSHNEMPHCTKWKLEGSVDGVNWTELHKVTSCVEGTEGYWSSAAVQGQVNNTILDLNCRTAGFGYEIESGIPGETGKDQLAHTSVNVAPGAVLKAEGDVELSAITIDAVNGNGTIDGFKFAADGVVNVINAERQRKSSFTLANIDAASMENLKGWSVTINGATVEGAFFKINESAHTITTNVGVHPVCIMLTEVVDAADFGLSPDAEASVNTKAMNDALAGGNRAVKISVPGEYLVDDTIFIDDNTTIDCVEGVVFKRTRAYCHMFINRRAYDWDANAYNKNITIRNLEIKDNGFSGIDGYDSPAKGMRGQVSLFKVKNVKVYNFKCVEFSSACYCIQFVDFDDILMDGFTIRGDKDGIHLNRGRNFVLRNGRIRTGDDGIALNAGDWPLQCTPTMGSIENGLIENVTDEFGGGCNFARIITGAWREWYDGMPLQRGDIFTVGTNVYTVAFQNLSTEETVSHIAPSHTRGVWTSPEGIPFLFLQGDGETRADIRNVTFRNCTLEAERMFSCSWEICEYARLVHPSLPDADLPVIDIRLENVHKTTPGHDYFIRGNANAKIDLENCSVDSGPLVYLYSNHRQGHAYDWKVRVNGGEWRSQADGADHIWIER